MSTVFEKLLSGEWPCAKVYEGGRVFVGMDASHVNADRMLVASKLPLLRPVARREHSVKPLGFRTWAKAG